MKILLGIFALFFFAMTAYAQVPPIEPGVPLELAKWRAEHYSDIRYELDLTLEKMAPTLKGKLAVEVTVRTEKKGLRTEEGDGKRETGDRGDSPITGPSSLRTQYSSLSTPPQAAIPIVLDWRRISGHEKLSRVFNVKINGNAAEYEEVNEHLVFRKGVVEGKNRIELEFESPILTSGSAITRYVDKEDGSEYIYSLFVPSDASTAFPVFDQPDLKARFELSGSFPEGWEVVTNAKDGEVLITACTIDMVPDRIHEETTIDGERAPKKENDKPKLVEASDGCPPYYRFEETKPISTYVFAFAAGPFEEITETENRSPKTGDLKPYDSNIGNRALLRSEGATDGSPAQAEGAVRGTDGKMILSRFSCDMDAGEDARGPGGDTNAGGDARGPKISTRSGSDGPSDRVPIRIFVRKSQAHKLLPPQAADAGRDARAPVGNTDAGGDARGPKISTRSGSDGPSDRVPIRIFVRKSQAHKLLPPQAADAGGDARGPSAPGSHAQVRGLNDQLTADRSQLTPADEVFRLNREAIEYLEDYFDYPFPFPKYDVVLIPEFPFGGMEHAGATFLRETSVIFPTEPTANNFISRASVIFHEAAHQWFGDTVTMKWFDDLWLKEGFATFMAYKTMEKVLPEYDPWKVFYQRTKSAAYETDVTRGTTPIHQELPNLSAAKSAYGNIVYQKAPSFLKQAEFFWGEEIFREAVRQFLNSHEFGNATWHDLVDEIAYLRVRKESEREFFKKLSDSDKQALIDFTRWHVRSEWAWFWVSKPGTAVYRPSDCLMSDPNPIADLPGFTRSCGAHGGHTVLNDYMLQEPILPEANYNWLQDIQVLRVFENGESRIERIPIGYRKYARLPDLESNSITRHRESVFPLDEESEDKKKDDYSSEPPKLNERNTILIFPNYRDYGYGIFLLDEKSRNYILKNIRDEKDEFLRAQMWGSLWDSVRFAELAPLDYINLAIANIDIEKDETTISSILGRTAYAFTYYVSEKQQDEVAPKLEALLVDKMYTAPTVGQRITYFRALLGVAKGEKAREVLKELYRQGDRRPETGDNGRTERKGLRTEGGRIEVESIVRLEEDLSPQSSVLSTREEPPFPIRPKDRFDIATRLIIIGDPDGARFLAELEKTEKDDAALRWAYAAKAGIATKENKAKYWKDFTGNKEISESWIEEASGVWNSPSHSELTLPYLDKALAELPNLKRDRKIFFVNNWLGSFIGGQKSEEALKIVNRFLETNPKLDADLRRKILENVDGLERAVKIRSKFGEHGN
ncbi:MAG: ERAP1-like C-terminal domain-containing protein [Aridibacter famidurans]|nr:ERAP1-like C-terminal domain-containing protein [Aridibacter famidurans]